MAFPEDTQLLRHALSPSKDTHISEATNAPPYRLRTQATVFRSSDCRTTLHCLTAIKLEIDRRRGLVKRTQAYVQHVWQAKTRLPTVAACATGPEQTISRRTLLTVRICPEVQWASNKSSLNAHFVQIPAPYLPQCGPSKKATQLHARSTQALLHYES
jgi:hypothetical protein